MSAYAELTRDLVDREFLPLEQEIESTETVPERALNLMRESGLFGLRIPEKYGGAGLSLFDYASVVHQLGRAHSAVFGVIDDNNGLAASLLLRLGTQSQRNEYLPQLATGQLRACFALTEAEAGSDVKSMRTHAVEASGHFQVTGAKQFISGAARADVIFTVARTDSGDGETGYGIFIVPRSRAGVTIRRQIPMMGMRGVGQYEVDFDTCRVEENEVLGGSVEGVDHVLQALLPARLIVAAWSLGAAARSLELGVQYCKSRKQFGRSIGRFQGVQWHVADSYTEYWASRALLWECAEEVDQGRLDPARISAAKLKVTEAAGDIADRMLQVHGASGYSSDLPLERIVRDLRAQRILEGTSEIQRSIIASHILRSEAGVP